MGKYIRNGVSDVSVVKTLQSPSNQSGIPERLQAKNTNFAHSFRPVHYISRFFGLMPFSIVLDPLQGIQKPQVTVFDGIWFLSSILMYISMAISTYHSLSFPRYSNTASYILMLGDSVLLLVGLVYSALIIIFDMRNRFKLVGILNKFITFDKEVSSHFNFKSIFESYTLSKCSQVSSYGIYYDYKKENRRAWCFCLIPVAVNLIFVLISCYIHRVALQHLTLFGLIIFFGSYAVENSISVMAAKTFITLTCNLRSRFAALNMLLRFQFRYNFRIFI